VFWQVLIFGATFYRSAHELKEMSEKEKEIGNDKVLCATRKHVGHFD